MIFLLTSPPGLIPCLFRRTLSNRPFPTAPPQGAHSSLQYWGASREFFSPLGLDGGGGGGGGADRLRWKKEKLFSPSSSFSD